jgi:hypothetical protein
MAMSLARNQIRATFIGRHTHPWRCASQKRKSSRGAVFQAKSRENARQ